MLNPFFLQGSKGEQNLVQDLINEQIRMYGVEVYYIPREYITVKSVIREVIESKFGNAYPIEAYVDTFEGYGGQGTMLTKFGVSELDDLTLIISKERYESYIYPLIRNSANLKLTSRPKEGDLIYFPLGDKLFEIKYVEHEKPFYQLQKNYVYELKCELFRYEDEVIDTGIDEIDNVLEDGGNSDNFKIIKLVGAGSTALAYTGIVNGGVRYVTITNRGTGYKSAPLVKFSSSPSNGGTATGIATMISGIVDICEPDGSLLRVQGVELTNPGYGYTEAPSVIFTGGSGTGAEATTQIGDGIVGIVTISNAGSGYITAPTVAFSAPTSINGVSAEGVAVINSNGQLTSIRITNAGLGYTQTPTITISSPVLIGSGSYKIGEQVVGASSSVTAYVRSWDSVTKELTISTISGEFTTGETLVGQESNAQYVVSGINIENDEDSYKDNANIETEADLIIDFSESNPFGTP